MQYALGEEIPEMWNQSHVTPEAHIFGQRSFTDAVGDGSRRERNVRFHGGLKQGSVKGQHGAAVGGRTLRKQNTRYALRAKCANLAIPGHQCREGLRVKKRLAEY